MVEKRHKIGKPKSFDEIIIKLASPEEIRSWTIRRDKDGNPIYKTASGEPDMTYGEVTKPETINYRSYKPEKEGLFCEKIFGPEKDWECNCGRYKKAHYKDRICEKCGVLITKSNVRRDWMGRIELATPLAHLWYLKGGQIATTLGMPQGDVEKLVYCQLGIVLDPGNAVDRNGEPLQKKKCYMMDEFQRIEAFNEDLDLSDPLPSGEERHFEFGCGAEAIQTLLKEYGTPEALDAEIETIREELENASAQRRPKLLKRLQLMSDFRKSGNKPEWMILNVLPVIPPQLRPMISLDGGRFATSDLNDLYRRIITRNNRMKNEMKDAPEQLRRNEKRMLQDDAPEQLRRNEKRMLQDALDALIDNGKHGRAVKGASERPMKSLANMLSGKQGRFRQNLLGKRVDYSGRSVIVVGPELKIYQCGVPKEMALELFKPFVMCGLVNRGLAENSRSARKIVEEVALHNEVWDVLEDVIHEHPVMLNRAPTLHRLGIQAFEPILVEGRAIKLHPLVCTAFNADFDGDQMAIHVPLSEEAQAECRFILLSPNNLLKPSDGGPVAVPSQDMVLGIYYLTQKRPDDTDPDDQIEVKGTGNFYRNVNEAIMAYENGCLDLHAEITVRVEKEIDGELKKGLVTSTLGRFLFNEIIPQDLGFVDRSKKENKLLPEVDCLVDKKQLKKILEKVIDVHGATRTAEVLDDVKTLGYKYSTKAAMTVSISDMIIPKEKEELLETAQKKVDQITANVKMGLLSEDERYKEVIQTWTKVDEDLTEYVYPTLGKYNNIYMMAVSGARGSKSQIKQLVGWRGLFSKTTGETIELPIKSNFREGLNVLEYFMSAHGSRKGMSDTALRTADSGYLTRRLVDVSQDVIVQEEDCAVGKSEIPGFVVSTFREGPETIEPFYERLVGRFTAEDVVNPKTGEILIEKNKMMTPTKAKEIVKALGEDGRVKIRTNLTCQAERGVCSKCYGANMATGEPVQVGEAVGIIAAQSIGEPGTQLTMRTFHTGGVAGGDITQGLPRVEELFESRRPKYMALISAIDGTLTVEKENKTLKLSIRGENGESRTIKPAYGSRLAKRNDKELATGDFIKKGDKLTEGSIYPPEILEVLGIDALRDYMLKEVQRPYRSQGVEINDKHIEIILRQMMRKVSVTEIGESTYILGEKVSAVEFTKTCEALEKEGKEPPKAQPILLPITKASLSTDSFLSATSFQETSRGLADAAVAGKSDKLRGIKENVIIGNLIPAGTGLRAYKSMGLTTDDEVKNELEILRGKGTPEEKPEASKTKEAEGPVASETTEE